MILLGEFNAKVGREDIFKPTCRNESLHETSNDNGVRVVNIATPKYLLVMSKVFPHHNIHKYTWTSPDGNTHNHNEHVWIDKTQHLNTADVRSFKILTIIWWLQQLQTVSNQTSSAKNLIWRDLISRN
jgi:hypothetical protein